MKTILISEDLPAKIHHQLLLSELPEGSAINAKWNEAGDLIEIAITAPDGANDKSITDAVAAHVPTKSDKEESTAQKTNLETRLLTIEARLDALENG